MNIVRLKGVDVWRSVAGVCLLCGQPLGIEPPRSKVLESFEAAQEEEEEDEAEPSEAYENFVRVALFKYKLLGSSESCHVIDRYTHLPPTLQDFLKVLHQQRRVVAALGGDLAGDLKADPGLFDKAADYCQRVAAKVVVPGCRACNVAMLRTNTHADIVYRCFPPSAGLSFPELEDSQTKEGRVVSRGIQTKKVVQQIALYFRPPAAGEGGGWTARDDHEIMPLACLWRCIANLCMWGRDGMARYRVVAVFYASMWLYERLALRDLMPFIEWSVHVFRPFYMEAYAVKEDMPTFFGMERRTAAVTFNAQLKAGPVWCEVLQELLTTKPKDAVEAYLRDRVCLRSVARFRSMLDLHVHDERSLFCYLSQTTGSHAKAVESIMSLFMFNFNDPKSQLLHVRGRLFSREICLQMGKQLNKKKPPTAAFGALSL
jgi:hypothetical protein